MKDAHPVLSIIVPTLDSVHFIGRCLRSISKQAYRNFEVLIVDGSKNEETVNEAMKWKDLIPCLRVLRCSTACTPTQVAFGVQNARGIYIGCVDSDDVIHSQMFQYLVSKALEFHADISTCGMKLFREEEVAHDDGALDFWDAPSDCFRKVSGKRYKRMLRRIYSNVGYFSRCTLIVRRSSLLNGLGIYSALPRLYWEDTIYDYLAFSNSKTAILSSVPLYGYIMRHSSSSNAIGEFDEYINYCSHVQKQGERVLYKAHFKRVANQTHFVVAYPLMQEINSWISGDSERVYLEKIRKYRKMTIWKSIQKCPIRVGLPDYYVKMLVVLKLGLFRLLYRRLRRK